MAPGQRMTLVVVPLLILAGLGLAIYKGAETGDEPLFSGRVFSDEELKNAEAALRKAGCGNAYRVEGRRILVAKTDAARCTAALIATDGASDFGKEFEKALDKSQWFTPSDTSREALDFARTKELVKMIRAIPHVEDASLVCQRSKKSVLRGESKMTATLGVRPRGEHELSSEEAQSLRQLVAGGFGMAACDVTVTDLKTGKTHRPEDRSDPVHDAYVEAIRRFTVQYQRTVGEALSYIPNVVVRANVEVKASATTGPGATSNDGVHVERRSDQNQIAGFTPRVMQIGVEIPNDYYRELIIKQGADQSDQPAFRVRLQRKKTDIEKEIAQKVARLIPAPSDGAADPVINVSSYDRPEASADVKPVVTTAPFEQALAQWGGPAGLTLVALCAVWFLRRGNVQTIEHPAAVALPVEDAAVTAPAEKLDPTATELIRLPEAKSAKETPERAAHERLEESLGKDEADAILENVKRSLSPMPFGFLRDARPETLASLVADEHPQTVALIFSNLPADQSARALKALPRPMQLEVIRRVATIDETSPEVIQAVEKSLKSRLQLASNRPDEDPCRASAVARMLSVVDRAANKTILRGLGRETPQLADEIRRMMFGFDDLARLDAGSIELLEKDVEATRWALALKGASAELNSQIIGSLSPRAAAFVQEEMQTLGPVRISDIEAAQQEIIDAVRRLEDAGEIVVFGSETEKLAA